MVLSLFNCVVLVVKIVLVLVVGLCKGRDTRWSAIGSSGMRNIVQSISVVLLLKTV